MRSRLDWSGPIHVIPNGLSADCFGGPADSERPDVDADGPVLISVVGRLVAHKRIERVFGLAERLRYRPATIEVIGRGPEAAALEEEITVRGLADVVKLRGFLPDAVKRATVAASALHVNTSQGEGWGLCVLEAAALGVPTVAYDVDGLRDAVRDGETGWLVKDGEQIEDATERALKELADPSRRMEIAAACRLWAARFEWDSSAETLARLLTAGPGAVRRASARGVPEAIACGPPSACGDPAESATSPRYSLDGAQKTG